MAKLRTLSGDDVVAIFRKFEFAKFSQRGSHVKMRRKTVSGTQSLLIPMHKEIDKGTLSAIFRQALRYILEAELAPHFFTK